MYIDKDRLRVCEKAENNECNHKGCSHYRPHLEPENIEVNSCDLSMCFHQNKRVKCVLIYNKGE